mmetsp:Transcript_53446/g.134994  ORF Transcript_53446/g.134994 Transcript_53446/m.134994 type:complete len:203 (+) Transcript_53446:874-1482(+)
MRKHPVNGIAEVGQEARQRFPRLIGASSNGLNCLLGACQAFNRAWLVIDVCQACKLHTKQQIIIVCCRTQGLHSPGTELPACRCTSKDVKRIAPLHLSGSWRGGHSRPVLLVRLRLGLGLGSSCNLRFAINVKAQLLRLHLRPAQENVGGARPCHGRHRFPRQLHAPRRQCRRLLAICTAHRSRTIEKRYFGAEGVVAESST